jgi:prefoldin subunit 5
MAGRVEETPPQLEPTDELPILSEHLVQEFDSAPAGKTKDTGAPLDESIDALRSALEDAESRWQKLEQRLESQDRAIAELRAALGTSDTPETSPARAALDDDSDPLETDATVEFKFKLDDSLAAACADEESESSQSVTRETATGLTLASVSKKTSPEKTSEAPTAAQPSILEQTARVPELTEIVAGKRTAIADAVHASLLIEESAEFAPRLDDELAEDTRAEAALEAGTAETIPAAGDASVSAAEAGSSADTALPPSREQQALLERLASLETYIDGRAAKWQAMESELDEKAARIMELENELAQRIARQENLEKCLHDESTRADALHDRLRRAQLGLALNGATEPESEAAAT